MEKIKIQINDFLDSKFPYLPDRIIEKHLKTQVRDIEPYYFIHILADNGELNRIPDKFLTKDTLSFKALDGWTAMHYAAASSCLHQIPNLSGELLEISSKGVATPMHYITEAREWKLVEQFLTPERICTRDETGATLLHAAIDNNSPDELPSKMFTPETLMAEDDYGTCVWHVIADHHPEFIENFLGMEFPSACARITGKEWWNKNEEILRKKKDVGKRAQTEVHDIDLF